MTCRLRQYNRSTGISYNDCGRRVFRRGQGAMVFSVDILRVAFIIEMLYINIIKMKINMQVYNYEKN